MIIAEVKKLKPGDRVFWRDPDRGLCSTWITIMAIDVQNDEADAVVSISGLERSLECYAHELYLEPETADEIRGLLRELLKLQRKMWNTEWKVEQLLGDDVAADVDLRDLVEQTCVGLDDEQDITDDVLDRMWQELCNPSESDQHATQ